jgi:putative membrane protein
MKTSKYYCMNTISQTNQDKLYFRLVLGISIFVFIAVVILNRKILPRPEIIPSFVQLLPKLNAIINGTCSVLLLISLYFIKQKNIAAHKRTNIITFILSSLFLVSYILFHYFADETKFPTENPLRPIYLIILISHIILAAGVLPLILLSFYYGLQLNVAKHKKLVRWTYPIWLYVTITGVIVYLMISPYYNF